MAGLAASEVGYSSSGGYWWSNATFDMDEPPELQWPNTVSVFNRMRRQDAQITSVLRAVMLPLRRTRWFIDPSAAPSPVASFIAEELGLPLAGEAERASARTRDRFSWSEHLQLALLMLPFGHAYFEQVYRPEGDKLHLRKLGFRPQNTISQFNVATDGGLLGITQYGTNGDSDVRIPVDRLVAYVNDREGGNWAGQSLLRPAYKFWLLKDRALRTQAQTLDRNGLGVPVYYGPQPPEELDDDSLADWQKGDLAAGRALATAFRSGDNSGAALPFGAKLKLQGVEGTLPDALPQIRYYDEQIARAVLANFLNLGGDNSTGSYALGETFADFFVLSLQTIAMQIADVTTQHVIEDLVDLNFGPDVPAPRLAFDEIGSRHPATADALQKLVAAKIINPDDALERETRISYGLPEATPKNEPAPAPSFADVGLPALITAGVMSTDEARELVGMPGPAPGPPVPPVAPAAPDNEQGDLNA